MEFQRVQLDQIAEQALAAYEVDKPQLAFIRHSDCVTYKVSTARSESFLFRLHIPTTSAMGAHGADYQMVNSEMTWLEALCNDTDLILQEPVRNRSGSLVTPFCFDNNIIINCTLLRWIDGQPYYRDLESPQTAYQIGVTLAKLHNHAGSWNIPDGFSRPKRDIPYFEDMLVNLSSVVKDGRIELQDFDELSTSTFLLIEMMKTLTEDRQTYDVSHGIMHADSHKGNMLYNQGKICFIDFSFCAIGNYLFDLGICFGDMKKELHPYCLESYQSLRPLPDRYEQLIEGFFLGSTIGYFTFLAANPGVQDILRIKVPQIVQDYARKFNRGEHFWF